MTHGVGRRRIFGNHAYCHMSLDWKLCEMQLERSDLMSRVFELETLLDASGTFLFNRRRRIFLGMRDDVGQGVRVILSAVDGHSYGQRCFLVPPWRPCNTLRVSLQ